MKTEIASTIVFLMVTIATAIPTDTPSIQWRHAYNCHDNGGGETDYATCVEPLSDGSGFFVGGRTNSLGPNSYDIWDNTDACVIRFDNNGIKQWHRTVGVKGLGTKGNDVVSVIRETADGGVIMPVVLSDTNLYLLARFSGTGALLWQKTFSASRYFSIADIRQSSDSGFIMTGGYEGSNWTLRAVWVVKFDKSGKKLWEKKFESGNCTGVGIIPNSSQDTFMVIANVDSTDFDPMFGTRTSCDHTLLLKFTPAGDTIWTKRYFGFNPVSVAKAGDSCFFVAGTSDPNSPSKNCVQLVKFSWQGDTLWTRTVIRKEYTSGKSVAMLEEGTVLLLGTTNIPAYSRYGTWLMCYGADGDSLWYSEYMNGNRNGYAVCGLRSGFYAIAGSGVPDGYKGSLDIWLLKGGNGPASVFEKFIGGRSTDLGTSLIACDKGYLILGSTQMYDRAGTVAIRTDDKGEMLWKKEYPFELGTLVRDSGDTWLFAGRDSTGFFLACTDTLAERMWHKTVHPDTTRKYYVTCFPVSSGGYYMVGTVKWNTGILIRLDDTGNELWSKTYPNVFFRAGLQQKSKTLVLLTESATLIGTDTMGNILWQRTMPMPGGYSDGVHGTTLVQTDDGKLTVFAGIGSGPYHQYIIHTDGMGNELWHKVYENKFPWSEKVRIVNGREYLVTGSTVGERDQYIAYLDSNAGFKWEKTFFSNDSLREFFTDFQVLPSGDIIAVGSEESKEYRDFDIVITELGKKLPVRIDAKVFLSETQVRPRCLSYKNRIVIEFPNNLPEKELTHVGVYSMDGKCLLSQNYPCRKTVRIQLQSNQGFQSSGIVLIKVSADNREWIFKTPLLH
jgi:hypothetical protein